jgi:hypothetical protein
MTTRTARSIATISGILVALVVAAVAVAQEPPGRGKRSPRDQVNQRFAETAPAVGEPVPDVVVYNADGNEHKLREMLRGRYAVLVLGCLT